MPVKTAFPCYRKTTGQTLDAVAKQFGVDRTTILRWEKGTTPLPVNRLDEFERVTGISRHDLRPDVFGPAEDRAA